MNLSFYTHFLFSCYSPSNNTFQEFKVLKKVITETFNINFHNKFIKFGSFCFSTFLHYTHTHTHTYIYIYIYIYTYCFLSMFH